MIAGVLSGDNLYLMLQRNLSQQITGQDGDRPNKYLFRFFGIQNKCSLRSVFVWALIL